MTNPLACPSCGAQIVVPSTHQRSTIECQHCKTWVPVKAFGWDKTESSENWPGRTKLLHTAANPRTCAAISNAAAAEWLAFAKRWRVQGAVALVLGCIVLAILYGAIGRYRTRMAVKRVYEEYHAKWEYSTDQSPSQLADAIDVVCSRWEQIDMASCPEKFKTACRRVNREARISAITLRQLPNNGFEDVVNGWVNSIVRGEQDGGRQRLTNEAKEAMQRMRDATSEMDRIAAEYID